MSGLREEKGVKAVGIGVTGRGNLKAGIIPEVDHHAGRACSRSGGW